MIKSKDIYNVAKKVHFSDEKILEKNVSWIPQI